MVVDASAAVAALLNDGQARRVLAQQQLHVPHLIDSEIASSLRRRVSAGQLLAESAWNSLRIWQRLGVSRYPMVSLLSRVWELRDNVSSHDAAYVALAEFLDCGVVTGDARLGRAPGATCAITVVPN